MTSPGDKAFTSGKRVESRVRVGTLAKIAEMRLELERLKAEHAAANLADPVAFVRDRLGDELWSKQKEILYSIRDNRLTTVRSCHASGKSWTVARAVAWWVSCHPPGTARVITTATTFNQVRGVLWQEIRRAFSAGKLPGVCNQVEWKIDDWIVAQGIKPDDYTPDAFQGIHAKFVLVVLDEANGIAPALWKAAISLITSDDSRMVAIGNPDDPHSKFAETHQPQATLPFEGYPGWHQIKISKDMTPNFSGEVVSAKIAEELIGPAWVADAKRNYGEGSPVYVSKVDAEFPEQSDDSLVRLSEAKAAVLRSLPPGEPSVLGVDVARYGSDKTVLMLRRGPVCRLHKVYIDSDIMTTAGRVAMALDETKAANAAIDADGMGAGVFDRLSELNAPVQELRGGFRARDHKRFANRRAEWYWELKTRFVDGEIDIDDDDELVSQLTSIRWKPNSRGQIQLETKEDMAKRGLPSPDKADALAYSFAAWDGDWAEAYHSTVPAKRSEPGVYSSADHVLESPATPEPNPWAEAYSGQEQEPFSFLTWLQRQDSSND